MPNLQSIKPTDPLLFLIGNKAAIQRLAGSSWTILIGAILVITAGIARNYDHLYFLTEWEWLYGPFAASIASSLFIFIIGYGGLLFRKKTKKQYLSFLSIYWMTAPCAWFYAIPVELYYDTLISTKFNFLFLLTVSIWRVILMTRAMNILTAEPLYATASKIIFPASLLMGVASHHKGSQLVSIMGGVRLPDEEFIYQVATATTNISFAIAIISFSPYFFSLFVSKKLPLSLPWKKTNQPLPALKIVGGLAIILLLAAIPIQTKLFNTKKFNKILNKQGLESAFDYARGKEKSDFLLNSTFPPGSYINRDLITLLSYSPGENLEWIEDQWISQLHLTDDNLQELIKELYQNEFGEPKSLSALDRVARKIVIRHDRMSP